MKSLNPIKFSLYIYIERERETETEREREKPLHILEIYGLKKSVN